MGTQTVHGKDVSTDSAEWSDDDVIWLAQWDDPAVRDDVAEQMSKRGISLSGNKISAPVQHTIGASIADYSTAELQAELERRMSVAEAEDGTGDYSDWTKDDLKAALDERGVEYNASDTKAELIDRLEAE